MTHICENRAAARRAGRRAGRHSVSRECRRVRSTRNKLEETRTHISRSQAVFENEIES